jgi:dCTP deaminase
MVLSDRDIRKCMRKGLIRFEPQIGGDQIGPASVDLTLDSRFWTFRKEFLGKKPVDLSKIDFTKATEERKSKSITIPPGGMALGITKEKIFLAAGIIGTLEGRSRYARMGLAVHVTSALVQPGSQNHQVLEIVNFAPFPVTIRTGMRISQVVFERLETKTSRPYSKFGIIAKKQ